MLAHRAPGFDMREAFVVIMKRRVAACTHVTAVEAAVHVPISLVFIVEYHVATVAALDQALCLVRRCLKEVSATEYVERSESATYPSFVLR